MAERTVQRDLNSLVLARHDGSVEAGASLDESGVPGFTMALLFPLLSRMTRIAAYVAQLPRSSMSTDLSRSKDRPG